MCATSIIDDLYQSIVLNVMRMSRKHKACMHNVLVGTVDRRGYDG